MAASAAKVRRAELGWIHQGAAALGLRTATDDTAYRDMLWAVARVRSAADLDMAGRRRVLDHLAGLGWKRAAPPARKPSKGDGQVRFLRMLWIKLFQAGHVADGTERAFRAYIRGESARYDPAGRGWDAPELIDRDTRRQLIEHMKRWATRVGVDW